MGKLIELEPNWGIFEFSWGSAIKDRKNNWIKAFIKPNGQEIDLEKISVELHENGIEFLK